MLDIAARRRVRTSWHSRCKRARHNAGRLGATVRVGLLHQGRTTMLAKFRRFRLSNLIRNTRGAEFVETIILVGLVALAGIAAFTAFGKDIQTKIQQQGQQVQGIN